MAGIKQRRRVANYLDVSQDATAVYAFMGAGFRTLEETPAAQTTSVRYINDASASKSINGYDWSTSFDTDQIRAEEAVDFICEIGELQKTGADCETNYVIVDLDKPIASKENTYHARRFKVAIEVASFTNNDGQMGCTGNLLGIGDPLIGEFNTAAKTFTVSEE